MAFVTIPDWDARGLIPPCDSVSPTSSNRSPYRVSLRDVVLEFAVSAERVAILKGFLEYRAGLHNLGMITGCQWLDGSFFENIELLELRPPNDIDIVTFYEMPAHSSQFTLRLAGPDLFPSNLAEKLALKASLHVDVFYQDLSAKPLRLIERSAYWYSVWSHRRDLTWKGFLEVDLAPQHDAAVLAELFALPPQQPNPLVPSQPVQATQNTTATNLLSQAAMASP